MPKTHRSTAHRWIGISLGLVTFLGLGLIGFRAYQWRQETRHTQLAQDVNLTAPSAVMALTLLPESERLPQLTAIAQQKEFSLDRARARYVLANTLIDNLEGGLALRQLENLEQEYPVMAPYVLLKRGRGYELSNEIAQAEATWQQVIVDYPDSLAVAEAYYWLGRNAPQYWQQAIADYPHHPITHQIAREQLAEDPNQLSLLLLLAKYAPHEPETNGIRDRLVQEYGAQLSPDDWRAIATGYWWQGKYGAAAQAYAQATPSSLQAYRVARGYHLDRQTKPAKAAYQRLVQQYPQGDETGQGLLHLASLSGSQPARKYLNTVIRQFPDHAPEALFKKAKILVAQGNRKAAAQAQQAILTTYPQSEAAARYRWQVAQTYVQQGRLQLAWQWALPIADNPQAGDLAPKAAFWVGKWAQTLGQEEDAKTAFQYVLAHFPQSYYAWRAAAILGWDVGNFTTVRQLNPAVQAPTRRSLPPAGSETFQELYRLGLDSDAIQLFWAEIGQRQDLSVEEQFTDGLLKLTQGRHLQGINQIWRLKHRETEAEIAQWQALRQTPDYWQGLFPLVFEPSIQQWSQKRNLNALLVTSLIRQESRFEPEIRSSAGATGLMQVLPTTGKWVANQIALADYSLTDPEDNINLGTWYFDYTHREYNNNSLLAIASYNAGPGNVAQWVKRFNVSDPDVFVEQIPFAETKGYVEAVFSNYWNYLRLYNPEIAQRFNPAINTSSRP